MATRIEPPSQDAGYDQDFYVWSRTQAQHLRRGRFDLLDLINLIEEVDDLGEARRRSVRSRMRMIIEHLLKLEHSPAQEPRAGWRQEVRTQRDDLADDLTPSLLRDAAVDLESEYRRALRRAAAALRDHGEDASADALPPACPYTLEQITGDWLP